MYDVAYDDINETTWHVTWRDGDMNRRPLSQWSVSGQLVSQSVCCVVYRGKWTVVRRTTHWHGRLCWSTGSTALPRQQSAAAGSRLLDQRWIHRSTRLTKVFITLHV